MITPLFFCAEVRENLATEIRPHEELVRVDALFRQWNARPWWRRFKKPPRETPLSVLELVALKHKLAIDYMEHEVRRAIRW